MTDKAETPKPFAFYRHRTNPERVLLMVPEDFANRTDKCFWMPVIDSELATLTERVSELEKLVQIGIDQGKSVKSQSEHRYPRRWVGTSYEWRQLSEVSTIEVSDIGRQNWELDDRTTPEMLDADVAIREVFDHHDKPAEAKPTVADEWNAKHKIGDLARIRKDSGVNRGAEVKIDSAAFMSEGRASVRVKDAKFSWAEFIENVQTYPISNAPKPTAADEWNERWPVGTEVYLGSGRYSRTTAAAYMDDGGSWIHVLGMGLWQTSCITPIPDAPQSETACGCETCCRERHDTDRLSRMIVCDLCGNKRCPHATNHRNECTNSNEPGQIGSSFENCSSASQSRQIADLTAKLAAAEKDGEELAASCKHWRERAEAARKLVAKYREHAADKYEWKRRAQYAEASEKELNAQLSHIAERFSAGTLHAIHCDGDHNDRVGAPGKICNCTLGVEIKQLRARAETAEAKLAKIKEV